MKKAPLLVVFLTVFIDLLGFGMIVPLLAEYGHHQLGATSLTAGALVGVYSFMQFLFAPVWGAVSDRVGRRPVLAWTLTIVEIIGGLALALGLAVRPLTLWFGIQIATGIAMIHGRAGWFVVGHGRNGAEYSVLIIACLISVALTDGTSYRLRLRHR